MEPTLPYLVDLTLQLASGLEHLEISERERQRNFFLSRQLSDGGFPGREGGSDLYYTAFALRGIALLGEPDSDFANRAADYLREQTATPASAIDTISLIFAASLLETWAGVCVFSAASVDWRQTTVESFEQLRRPDGGYAKTLEGHASSTYQTFLVALAYQLLEKSLPDPQRAGEFILGQAREGGGFVEIGVMRRSGTNPTAAAIGTLRVLQSQTRQELLTPAIKKNVARFLVRLVNDEGGYRANTQILLADLLSTYTALQTLRDVGYWDQIDAEAVLRFVRSLQDAAGGFRAAAWDDTVDVEYSFYGMASLGLLLAGTRDGPAR
ncbi:MAG: beta-hydroxylase [Planctomycetes bacterium]|nr:beta-hydroxylase [Planctomycetota bacterium]